MDRSQLELDNLFANEGKYYYFSMGILPKDIKKVLLSMGYSVLEAYWTHDIELEDCVLHIKFVHKKNCQTINIEVDTNVLSVRGKLAVSKNSTKSYNF